MDTGDPVQNDSQNQKQKGNKKKKGKKISLDEFLSTEKSNNWAVLSENPEDDYENNVKFDRSTLPSAPKAAMGPTVDMSQIPKDGPFSVYIGNLSYEASEEDLQKLFSKLEIDTVRIIMDGGRPRGYAYVDFLTKESLIEALSYNDREYMGRTIRVDLATDKNRDGRGLGGPGGSNHSNEPDRTEGDWRRRDPADTPSSVFGSRDDSERNSRFGDRDRGYGFGGDRDRDRRGGAFGDRDRDRGFGNRDRGFGDRDRGFGDRDRGFGGDRDRAFGGRDRGFGNDRDRGFDRGGDRDRAFGGDRDRGFGGDRDRAFGGDRDRAFGGDRDKGFGGDRDRGFGGDRDRDFGDRGGRFGGSRGGGSGFEDRQEWREGRPSRPDNGFDKRSGDGSGEREGPDRDRGGRFGAPRGGGFEKRDDFASDRGPRSRDGSQEHRADLPKERPVLKLQPRSKPAEDKENQPEGGQSRTSSIFGSAKPVDTYAKEKEIEEKLKKKDVPRDEPRRREDESGRSRRYSDEGSVGQKESHSSRVSEEGDDPRSPTSPKSAEIQQPKMVPAPPPKENAWSRKRDLATPASPTGGQDTSQNASTGGPKKDDRQTPPASGRGGGPSKRPGDHKGERRPGPRANGDGSGGDHPAKSKPVREKQLPKSIDEMPKFEESRAKDFSDVNKFSFLMEDDDNDDDETERTTAASS